MSGQIIGGIEGGATHSNCILLDQNGTVLAKSEGPGTNHHHMGMVECRNRIAGMVNEAKKSAKVPLEQPLSTLGLSLSGCESEDTNQELVRGLQEAFPTLSKTYAIGSDTEGSVAATSNRGGVVCIAGTGSNTLLINPDGSRSQCGGWGYLLGDEGSAWKISHRAIKYCFDSLDNFEEAPFPIEKVWRQVQQHFHIQTQADILTCFYSDFDKARIAALCKGLSELATAGDRLSQYVFEEAGMHLARSIAAVVSKAAEEFLTREGGLHVLCVGSVWKSWDLLKPGFVTWLRRTTEIENVSLLRLKTTMAVGAAYMAADKNAVEISRNYGENYEIFYKYDRKNAFAS